MIHFVIIEQNEFCSNNVYLLFPYKTKEAFFICIICFTSSIKNRLIVDLCIDSYVVCYTSYTRYSSGSALSLLIYAS